MGPMWDMLRGRKSKDVDKWIRCNSKRANREVTHGKEGEIPLEWLDQTGREREKEKKGEKIEEEKRREKLLLLYSFPGDSTVNVHQSER